MPVSSCSQEDSETTNQMPVVKLAYTQHLAVSCCACQGDAVDSRFAVTSSVRGMPGMERGVTG
jgi:hypothetical protein